ncbi:MAG TPA: serine/threonine-protein kinase [Kofleriaceae bacterium]|nr:serine/threonine-protein kinase [Kofleriaceae bacterium]
MGSSRQHLAAFASLHLLGDLDERRRAARQGLAMLAQIAEREPAPLEGLDANQLLLAVRAMLGDGVLGDLDWLSPAAAAVAMFELGQAVPAGAERRELGRRVLTRLRDADRDTFVRLLVALARSSPKVVASEGLRARLEVVLSAPLTAPGSIGELALGLLAQPSLAQSWVEVPATGSLPARRLAGRILAHGAREALRRLDGGDRGGVQVLARPGVRAALRRLLGDREALVWRFASIARGMLAHVDSELADDIDRELRNTATNTEVRRASASAGAALERGGQAQRWAPLLVERAAKEPGVTRGTILGLAGLAIVAPGSADALAIALVERQPLEAAEAIAELRREEAVELLHGATAAALAWTRGQAQSAAGDDSRSALLQALERELGGSPTEVDGIGIPIAAARAALDAGDTVTALREARMAVAEITEAADWLAQATDDDALDRRHSMRLLRELDRELLADNALPAVLALAGEHDPVRAQFSTALAAIEAALLAREAKPESGGVQHGGLRIARLRALVRLLDGVRAAGDNDLGPRLAAVRQLMARAEADQSSLRRAVWAALTRAGDALLRDGHAELTDFLLSWTTVFPDEDFAIVREASMVPEIEAAFAAYARLQEATWAATDPDDTDAIRTAIERLAELADALPPEQSPRVESVRLALARLGNQLARLVAISNLAAIPAGTLDAIANELGTLSRRVFGARQRLGLAAGHTGDAVESAVRAIELALASHAHATGPDLDEPVATAIEHARAALPPAIAAAVERVLVWLAQRPHVESEATTTNPLEVMLPSWVPLSRLLGGFYVVRPIGRGAGGSVLLAVRSEQRGRTDRELVALKVPDYSAEAARNLSEQEFERLFREEAGALLALPAHANLARFVTFDASAQPKPVLVMEFVRGPNLERTLEAGDLTLPRAFAIIDDLLAGLEAMHAVQIAHLDVKPPNVVLRESTGNAVLVDFGLAGRRIRAGCGSVHYGAAEVWTEGGERFDPSHADVYASGCVAYEVLTGSVLFGGDSVKEVIDQHFTKQPAADRLAKMARDRKLAPLAELLRATLAREPTRRPSAARLRAGFKAIAHDLVSLPWPLRI